MVAARDPKDPRPARDGLTTRRVSHDRQRQASTTGAAATTQARRGRVIAVAIGITLAGVVIILALLSR